jgi:hypothetical protein
MTWEVGAQSAGGCYKGVTKSKLPLCSTPSSGCTHPTGVSRPERLCGDLYACLPSTRHTFRAMSPPPKPPIARGIAAGSLLVAPMILGAAVGFGIGSAVGATALLTILGLFAGLAGGFALVISRFRDL